MIWDEYDVELWAEFLIDDSSLWPEFIPVSFSGRVKNSW